MIRNIGKVIGWLMLLGSLSALGLGTDNPSKMVPVYGIFFTLCFVAAYFWVRTHQKRETRTESPHAALYRKIFGVVLLVLAACMPAIILRGAGFTPGVYALIIGVTIALIALGTVAVKLINKNVGTAVIGYIFLFALSSVPAFMMMQYEISYNALGTAYYSTILVAVLGWWGLSTLATSSEE